MITRYGYNVLEFVEEEKPRRSYRGTSDSELLVLVTAKFISSYGTILGRYVTDYIRDISGNTVYDKRKKQDKRGFDNMSMLRSVAFTMSCFNNAYRHFCLNEEKRKIKQYPPWLNKYSAGCIRLYNAAKSQDLVDVGISKGLECSLASQDKRAQTPDNRPEFFKKYFKYMEHVHLTKEFLPVRTIILLDPYQQVMNVKDLLKGGIGKKLKKSFPDLELVIKFTGHNSAFFPSSDPRRSDNDFAHGERSFSYVSEYIMNKLLQLLAEGKLPL
jgi:hypothetical protein